MYGDNGQLRLRSGAGVGRFVIGLADEVKIIDLTDNMDIRRLPYLSDKDVKRLKKYPQGIQKTDWGARLFHLRCQAGES